MSQQRIAVLGEESDQPVLLTGLDAGDGPVTAQERDRDLRPCLDRLTHAAQLLRGGIDLRHAHHAAHGGGAGVGIEQQTVEQPGGEDQAQLSAAWRHHWRQWRFGGRRIDHGAEGVERLCARFLKEGQHQVGGDLAGVEVEAAGWGWCGDAVARRIEGGQQGQ